MGYIVAIGGGTTGGRGTEYQTESIDRKVVELAGKPNPNFLFIGFATTCPDSYYRSVKRNYKRLGCSTDILYAKNTGDKNLCAEKFGRADIIYLGGGNTITLMRTLRAHGTDLLLKKEFEKGKVICGISAGAIAISKFGNSDSRKYATGKNIYIKVTGTGLLDLLFCPHYDVETARHEDLKRMMKTTYVVPALAVDNCAALVTDRHIAFIEASMPGASASKFYYKNGKYTEIRLKPGEKYLYSDFISKKD